MPAKKYFIAIVIPEPILSEIEQIKQELFEHYHLKGALRSPAHITLHRPFEWKEEKEAVLIQKIEQFKAQATFDIHLQGFSFFEPRVVFINLKPDVHLNNLHQQVLTMAKRELNLFNEADDMRGFHPHVTVAFRDLKKSTFYVLKEKFTSQHFEAHFLFSGITLLKLEKKWEPIITSRL